MAKKTEVPAEDRDRMSSVLASELMEQIRKKHGKSILMRASDFNIKKVPRIPSGIFLLDYALGGGFPAGRVNVVYGKKSASKTTTVLKSIAQAQQMCGNCWTFPERAETTDPDSGEISVKIGKCVCKNFREVVAAYVDVEGTWDAQWATTLGVDTSRLMLSVPDYAEQGLDIADALLRSGNVDVLALDSIAFLTPSKEIEESIEKDMMGVQPRIVGRGIRKFVSAINTVGNETGRRPTIFLTNQIRMMLGVMFGNPETTPGGMAPGFAASVELKLWSGKYEMDEVTGKPLYADMNFRVEKNKTSSAKMEGAFRIILMDSETKKKGEIYDEDGMLSLAEKVGILEKDGGKWRCLGKEFNAKSQVERALLLEKDFKAKLRTTLFEVLLVG